MEKIWNVDKMNGYIIKNNENVLKKNIGRTVIPIPRHNTVI